MASTPKSSISMDFLWKKPFNYWDISNSEKPHMTHDKPSPASCRLLAPPPPARAPGGWWYVAVIHQVVSVVFIWIIPKFAKIWFDSGFVIFHRWITELNGSFSTAHCLVFWRVSVCCLDAFVGEIPRYGWLPRQRNNLWAMDSLTLIDEFEFGGQGLVYTFTLGSFESYQHIYEW